MVHITPFPYMREACTGKNSVYRVYQEHDAGVVYERFQREIAGYIRTRHYSYPQLIDRILFRIHFFHTDVGQELLGVHCVREVDAL